jgi:hypothetical protein
MTSETWDNVPPPVNSQSEKGLEVRDIATFAERTEIPATMTPGGVLRAMLQGEPVYLVGTVPTG